MKSQNSKPIAVLYLARKAEGLEPFRKFIQSYAKHAAGIEHELVILFKGYDSTNELEEAKSVFKPHPFLSFELPDESFDIGSYLAASELLGHEYICPINTFTQILSDNWLYHLFSHASLPSVGIVGGTGSYEGLSDTVIHLNKAHWMTLQQGLNPNMRKTITDFFGFSFSPTIKPLICKNFKQRLSEFFYHFRNKKEISYFENDFLEWWQKAKHFPDISPFCFFPAFPNPHIRSNGFMIKRKLFLELKRKPFRDKFDACFFESGPEGMTKQILQKGLKARIIAKEGTGYDVENWMYSKTFRLNSQENLIFGDNHTHAFSCVCEKSREAFKLITWGENCAPKNIPELGIRFQNSKPFH